MNDILALLAGIIALTMGRQMFWLFVAVIGAVAGAAIGAQVGAPQSIWIEFAAMIAGSIIGALLGIFLQSLAAMAVGFYTGGIIFQSLALMLGFSAATAGMLPFWIGGILGAILILLTLNWALILLSSLYGATLISTHSHLPPTTSEVLWVVLVVVGIVIQATIYRRNPAI